MEKSNTSEARADEVRLAYTVREVSQLTPFSITTLYKMMNDGRLPSRKEGGRRLILRKHLLALLEGEPQRPCERDVIRPRRAANEA